MYFCLCDKIEHTTYLMADEPINPLCIQYLKLETVVRLRLILLNY